MTASASRDAASPWDLTALLNAADPKASLAERHLWVIRLLEWLRHAPLERDSAPRRLRLRARRAPGDATPTPVLRLKHMLGVLERHPEHRAGTAELLALFMHEVDSAALLADFGFAPRMGLWGEFGRRLRARVLPLTPATSDLADLFGLLFPRAGDADWLLAVDNETLARIAAIVAPADAGFDWRAPFFDAIMFLASAVRAAGFSPALRQRMSPELLVDAPFRQLARVAEQVRELAETDAPDARVRLLVDAQYLRALLDTCRRCAVSVHEHLETHGVSVDVVFDVDQLLERTHRIDALLTCVLSPEPGREIVRLLAELIRSADERRSIRALFSQHYSLLARKVAERSAATGEHYITRDRAEYRAMLRAAIGGGAVLGVTTLLKFMIGGAALAAFWNGLAAGLNYAAAFVLIQVLHFTVATKQPAMTAPAMAEKLGDVSTDIAVASFVDEVANLIRSQSAGIIGNVLAVVPVVLLLQWLLGLGSGGAWPLDRTHAEHTLHSLSLLGPTPLYAAFTGVLLFTSSMIAGWVENWFVWHRLDSAIAWNPKIVARLGAARAQRWAAYSRASVSGFTSNVSLGLMLGLVPVIAAFFGLALDVRHVTLAAGQLAASVGVLGADVLHRSDFWWCVAGVAATGVLNLAVSFFLAFRVALRSRGIRLADRSRIHRAIRARLWREPASFVVAPAHARIAPVEP
ncbi:site-specific recombinase [Piscinibacter koreensis]|uniref:site-specific recombinase n=1 Tax=Piscinibacter koreensis TaxID=2742824 RepID=UPI003158923A